MNSITTSKSYLKIILTLALPLIIANLISVIYSMTDIFWIGKLGVDYLSGISSVSIYLALSQSLFLIIKIGFEIRLAHEYALKEKEKIRMLLQSTLIFSMIILFFYCILVYLNATSLVAVFNLNSDLSNQAASDYLKALSIAIFFVLLNQVFVSYLISQGKTKKVLWYMSIGIILNIILDPILIFGFDLKASGAAHATTLAALTTTIIFVLNYHKDVGKLNLIKFKEFLKSCSLGYALSIEHIVNMFSIILLTRTFTAISNEALAAYKIVNQLESLGLMIVVGIASSMSIFSAQNAAMRQFGRIKKSQFELLRIILLVSVGYLILIFINPKYLISIFSQNTDVIAIATQLIYPLIILQIFIFVDNISAAVLVGLKYSNHAGAIALIFSSIKIVLLLLCSNDPTILQIITILATTSILKSLAQYFMSQFMLEKEIKLKKITP